jgi:hypothetical protein
LIFEDLSEKERKRSPPAEEKIQLKGKTLLGWSFEDGDSKDWPLITTNRALLPSCPTLGAIATMSRMATYPVCQLFPKRAPHRLGFEY